MDLGASGCGYDSGSELDAFMEQEASVFLERPCTPPTTMVTDCMQRELEFFATPGRWQCTDVDMTMVDLLGEPGTSDCLMPLYDVRGLDSTIEATMAAAPCPKLADAGACIPALCDNGASRDVSCSKTLDGAL